MKSNLNIKQIKKNADQKFNKHLLIDIKSFLNNNMTTFSNIDSILLFGSYARKNYNKNSDIDFCVILKKGTPHNLETNIFKYFLDLSKKIDILVEVVFIYPENIDNMDHTLLESILAEGQLLYGNTNYIELLFKNIKLEPYQIVNFNLKNLSSTNKMKFKRMLYGYNTSRKYSKKMYNYHREGTIHKIEGRKLSPGAILIPEMSLPLIEKKFKSFNVNFSNFRIWKQKV